MASEPGYDFVIVGAGTAGCVLAARLSAQEDVRVLLIEAGSATLPPASAAPPQWQTLLGSSADWGGPTAVQDTLGRAIHVARGRGFGGSSAINAMMFARGHRESYDDWPEGWRFDDLLPYFMRSEASRGGDPALRGKNGPLRVGPASPVNPLLAAALDAAVECGYAAAEDISSGDETGFGAADLTIDGRRRQTAADAYLVPAMDRPNLDVISDAVVHRLVISEGRCTGVEFHRSSSPSSTCVRSVGEIVLAAGAIGSAQLLMVSGVGPEAHLRDVGVDVVHHLPGVGANFQDHPLSGVIYTAAQPIPTPEHNHGEVMGLIRTASPRCNRTVAGGFGSRDRRSTPRRWSIRTTSLTSVTGRRCSRASASLAKSAPRPRWRRGAVANSPRDPRWQTMNRCDDSSATPSARTTTRQARAPWETRTSRWSTRHCACTVSRVCVWRMRPSCRPCRRTTRWQRFTASPSVQPI